MSIHPRAQTGEGERLATGQGKHPDPEGPAGVKPDPASWTERWRAAWESEAMMTFRGALSPPSGGSTREGVIQDLSRYYGIGAAEVVECCLDWERRSIAEWQARPRDTPAGLVDFYQHVTSWSFDLLWYQYLQTTGHEYPASVAIALDSGVGRGRRVLDFGSGVGAAGQLLCRFGYEVDLADISTTLLEFARYRLQEHGDRAGFLDLNQVQPQPDTYDVILAVDTLAHVPDVGETARMLHRALRPGGVLYANFDVRPEAPANAWHLYSDDRALRWQLQRAGFEPATRIDWISTRYRRVEPGTPAHRLRGARDTVYFRTPARTVLRRVRGLVRK